MIDFFIAWAIIAFAVVLILCVVVFFGNVMIFIYDKFGEYALALMLIVGFSGIGAALKVLT